MTAPDAPRPAANVGTATQGWEKFDPTHPDYQPRPAANVTDVLAALIDTALRAESQHDPGCPGDEKYCVLHCPVPVQVEVPLSEIAAALAEAGIGPVAEAVNAEWNKIVDVLADHANQVHEAERRGAEATGLLNDLVTAKKLRLDAEEWQLVWDRVFRFLARAAAERGAS